MKRTLKNKKYIKNKTRKNRKINKQNKKKRITKKNLKKNNKKTKKRGGFDDINPGSKRPRGNSLDSSTDANSSNLYNISLPSTVASDVSFIENDPNDTHDLDLDLEEELADLTFDEPTEEELLRREQITGRLSSQAHAPSFDESYELSSDDETVNIDNNENNNENNNITNSNLTSNESFYFGDESTLNNPNVGINQVGLNLDDIGDLNEENNESLNTTIETPHGMSLGSEHNINDSDSDNDTIGGRKKKTKKNKKRHNKKKLTKKKISFLMKGGVKLDQNYGVTNPFPEVNLHE